MTSSPQSINNNPAQSVQASTQVPSSLASSTSTSSSSSTSSTTSSASSSTSTTDSSSTTGPSGISNMSQLQGSPGVMNAMLQGIALQICNQSQAFQQQMQDIQSEILSEDENS